MQQTDSELPSPVPTDPERAALYWHWDWLRENWWEELYANWLPGDTQWDREAAHIRSWAEAKVTAARTLCPTSIAEIGVRAGYSAFCFLSQQPMARFLGVDHWEFMGWGGEEAARVHASFLLSEFPNVALLQADSHTFDRLPGSPYEFVHVDGDHSVKGVLLDLDLALNSGAQWILVDDTTGIPEVGSATRRWLRRHPTCKTQQLDSGPQGSTLIEVVG